MLALEAVRIRPPIPFKIMLTIYRSASGFLDLKNCRHLPFVISVVVPGRSGMNVFVHHQRLTKKTRNSEKLMGTIQA